jgi:hypothetical protein
MFKRGILVAEILIGLIGAYMAYLGEYTAAMGCVAVIASTLDKLTDKKDQ